MTRPYLKQSVKHLSGAHEGEDMFIVASGPSLAGFDFSLLDGRLSIAINHAVYHVAPSYHLFFDRDPAREFSSPNFDYPEKTRPVTQESYLGMFRGDIQERASLFLGSKVFEKSPDHLFAEWTSVAPAIHLSARMGCAACYLLGVDLFATPDRYHFYDNQAIESRKPGKELDEMGRVLGELARHLREHFPGMGVYNLSPESKLDCFPKLHWEDVLCERNDAEGAAAG